MKFDYPLFNAGKIFKKIVVQSGFINIDLIGL